MSYIAYPNSGIVERVRKASHLTQKDLATRAGLTVLFVIRAEQGIPQTLGHDLERTLANLSRDTDKPMTIADVEHDYAFERHAMLNFYKEMLRSHPGHEHFVEVALGYALDNYTAGVGDRRGSRLSHPLCLFRTKLMSLHEWPTSAIKFNQFFGLHASIISSIETRKDTIERHSATFNVLRDTIGLSEIQLEMLMKACDSCL